MDPKDVNWPANSWSELLRQAMANPGQPQVMRIHLKKDQLDGFLNGLQEIQDAGLEQAVEASGYQDALTAINRIRQL